MNQQESKSFSNPYVVPMAKITSQRNVQADAAAASKLEDSGPPSSVQQNNFINIVSNDKGDESESPGRPSDLVDISLQAKQTDARPGGNAANGIDERFSLADSTGQPLRREGTAAARDQQDEQNNNYNFLKFHMVEDDNATDGSLNNQNQSDNEDGRANIILQPKAGGRHREDQFTGKGGDQPQQFGKRKGSHHSQFSKGSGGQNLKKNLINVKGNAMSNNFMQQAQIHNPVVSSVMKQQGWDKMKNLKSVLDTRKASKGASGTRPGTKARKPSGEPTQMNIHNQKGANARKSSQEATNKRPPSQSSKNSGKTGTSRSKPTSQFPANKRVNPMISLTGGGMKAAKKQMALKKQQSEPSNQSQMSDQDRNARDYPAVEQPDNEYLETMKLRMRGLPDLRKSSNATSTAIQPLNYGQLDSMDTQEIINRANDAVYTQQQRNEDGASQGDGKDRLAQLQSSAGGKSSYSVRAMRRQEEAEKKKDQQISINNQINHFNTIEASSSMAALPTTEDPDRSVELINDMFGMQSQLDDGDPRTTLSKESGEGYGRIGQHASRKPKFLMSKLSNLMKDTKSSANRNRKRGQFASPFGPATIPAVVGPGFPQMEDQAPKRSPVKAGSKPQSPKRRQKSPGPNAKKGIGSSLSTSNLQSIINLKSTPTKFDQINEILPEADEYLQQIKEKRDQAAREEAQQMKITFYDGDRDVDQEQRRNNESGGKNADIPATDSPSQITLEGISGMVVMDASALEVTGSKDEDEDERKNNAFADGLLAYDEDDIRKGESGGASSSSSSERLTATEGQDDRVDPDDAASPLQPYHPGVQRPALDLDSIRIDEKELHEISKSSREQQEKRTSKNNEFNSELLSIIGSINLRAKELKAQCNIGPEGGKQGGEAQGGAGSDLSSAGGPPAESVQSIPIQMMEVNRDSLSYSQNSKRANTNRTGLHHRRLTDDGSSVTGDDEEDPLKAVALDLSSEANEMDEKSINDNIPKKYSNLDQTIIIGEMEEGNIFDDLRMSKSVALEQADKGSELTRQISQFTDQELERLKEKDDDGKAITISVEDLQELVDNIKLKHRAEIDAIMNEQGAYKRIIQGLIEKLKQQQTIGNEQEIKIIGLRKFEVQAKKFSADYTKLESECKFYRNEVDKFKIALIEYDRHVRETVIQTNEFHIQQLETENAHLRKLLNIPEELFKVDPEEEKKKEADKKRGMLKSIDEKLKAAEKKIQKKQTAQELYYQQQKQHGFDPFELDQEEYDMYRLSKLKDHEQMPKDMKGQLQNKIYGKMEERSYREEMRRHHEKEILEEFARVYGYDVNKHQPHSNNGEIDVEYLQAYIAECRAKEEKLAEKLEAEKTLTKQKEALKGKVAAVTKPRPTSTNNTGTKSSAPSVKKHLTVETDHNLVAGSGARTASDSTPEESSDSASEPSNAQQQEPSQQSAAVDAWDQAWRAFSAGETNELPPEHPDPTHLYNTDRASFLVQKSEEEAQPEHPAQDGASNGQEDKAKPVVAETANAADAEKVSQPGSDAASGDSTALESPLREQIAQNDADDDFDRDAGAGGEPMTREELADQSSNSVSAIQGKRDLEASDAADEPIADHDQMSATLSEQSLQEMLKSAKVSDTDAVAEGTQADAALASEAPARDEQNPVQAQEQAASVEAEEDPAAERDADDIDERQDDDGSGDAAGDFDPYNSSLSLTFKAGQRNQPLDFGLSGDDRDDLEEDKEEEREDERVDEANDTEDPVKQKVDTTDPQPSQEVQSEAHQPDTQSDSEKQNPPSDTDKQVTEDQTQQQ